MTDLDVIELLLSKHASDPGRSKAAQLAEKLGTYPQAVTHMVTRKRIPAGYRLRAYKLAKAAGAKLNVEWLVLSPPKPGKRKDKTNGRTRHAAKAGQRNRKRQKPKSGKATARKRGKGGAQRAAV